MLSDDTTLLSVIQQADDLTDLSKKQYTHHLRKLQRLTGNRTLLDTITDVGATLRALDTALTPEQIHTRHALSSAVVALTKRVKWLKEKYPEACKAWTTDVRETIKPITARMDSNRPTPRQQEGFVSLADVIQKRDSLPMGSWERLLLVVYTETPPVRRDHWRTPLLGSRDTPSGVRSSSKDASPPDEDNYIRFSKDGKEATLHLRQFKSHKHFGDQQLPLNRRFVAELNASLQRFPRRYLFVSLRDNVSPYNSHDSYGHWCNKTLKALFDRKHINLTMLRHIYISAIDMNNTSRAERMEIARRMQHSETRQQQYRLIFRDDDKGAHVKTCVCR
jgi:hypothetical protein